jgi:FAD/FMN-containing dehydrogenase
VVERTREAFPRESYQRLVELKRQYDPKNLLRSGFNFGSV